MSTTNTELDAIRRRLDSIDPARQHERETAARAQAIDDRRAHIISLIDRHKAAVARRDDLQAEHDRLLGDAQRRSAALEKQLVPHPLDAGRDERERVAAQNHQSRETLRQLWTGVNDHALLLRKALSEVEVLRHEAGQYGPWPHVLSGALTDQIAEHGRVTQQMLDRLPRRYEAPVQMGKSSAPTDYGLPAGVREIRITDARR